MIEEYIQNAITFYTRASGRVEQCLSTTPDERLHWSPSESARSPFAIAAHCGFAVSAMTKTLSGAVPPRDGVSTAHMDEWLREQESRVTTREQVIAALHEANSEHVAWLKSLTPEVVEGTANLGLGAMPMKLAVHIVAGHLHDHAAQMEYIQTIYGDREWRM